jgi:hypothetical protein
MESSAVSTASRWVTRNADLLLALALTTACASSQTRPEGEGAAELPYYTTPDLTATWIDPGARRHGDIHRIAPFSFVDQDGRQVTNASLEGKI